MKTAVLLATALLIGSTVLAQDPGDDFRRLDKNQDGKLTKDEFKDVSLAVDWNKDGSISSEEAEIFLY